MVFSKRQPSGTVAALEQVLNWVLRQPFVITSMEASCTLWPPRTLVAAVLAAIVSVEPAIEVAVMSAARRLSMSVVSGQEALMPVSEDHIP